MPHYGKGILSDSQSIDVDHTGLRTYCFESYYNWKCDVHTFQMYK